MESVKSSDRVPDLTGDELTAFSSGPRSAAFLIVNVRIWFWCDNRKQVPAILKKVKCHENDNRLKGEKRGKSVERERVQKVKTTTNRSPPQTIRQTQAFSCPSWA